MRGLAVAAVLAYHANLAWARGGFLGVDAFFVLSGYLITGLLLAEWRASGAVNLVGFWTRRARRLLPALFLMLAGVACYAAVFAGPEERSTLRWDAVATLAYVANWRPVFAGQSYFEQFSIPSPLLHTWSLAVEEQWYAVWPVLAIFLLRLRRGSTGMLIGAALVMAAGSALLMGWLYDPQGDPSRVYYGTDTRAQSLLVGAALAGVLTSRAWMPAGRRAGWLLQAAGLACAGYIAWMWATSSGDSVFLYRGGFLLLALAVSIVIAATATSERGPLARVLSLRPLRALGVISYGVYLWHWPIYLVLTPDRTGWDGHSLFAARIFVTLVIAAASHQLIELPFRREARWRWPGSWALAPAAGAALAMSLVLVTRGGAPAVSVSTPSSPPAMPAAATSPSDAGQTPAERVLVVGDSVAFTMAQGLARRASNWNLSVWNQAKIGCGVLRGDAVFVEGRWVREADACNDWPTRWQSYVDAFQPDVVVVLTGAWDLYNREVGGHVLEFGTPEADAFALGEFGEAVDVLSSRGATVMLLTTPYFKQRDLALPSDAPRFDPARIDRLNELFGELVRQRSGAVRVLDLNGFLGSASENNALRSAGLTTDGVHFTAQGADMVAGWLGPEINEAARGNTVALASPTAAAYVAGEAVPARWIELLGHVPDTAGARAATVMNDYARFRAVFGVALPGRDADEGALFEYYRKLLFDAEGNRTGLVPADVTGISDFPPRLMETRAQYGFTLADIDQDVSAGGLDLQILRGRIDPAAAGDAARRQSSSSGEGGRVAARGGYLFRSANAKDLDATVHLADGDGKSLADAEDVQLLAAGLDRLGTYTALFSTDRESYTLAEVAKRVAGPDASAGQVNTIRDGLQREGMLLAYEAYATGAGVDARGPFTALVLLHADEAAARANVQRLRLRIDHGTSWIAGQPFAELIDDVEITPEGRVVLAKLRSRSHGVWFALHAARDTLLVHE